MKAPPTPRIHIVVRGQLHKNMEKFVKVADMAVQALVDTGSEIMAMRHDLCQLICSHLQAQSIQLAGLGGHCLTPLGSYKEDIRIDETPFTDTHYVVDSSQMSSPLLTGRDIIEQSTVICNEYEIFVEKNPHLAINYISMSQTHNPLDTDPAVDNLILTGKSALHVSSNITERPHYSFNIV